MAIKLQDLTSELHLNSAPFQAGTKIALAGIGALIAGVAAAAAGVGIMVKKTFEWANEVDSLGDVMGGTNEQLAGLAFLARKSGVGVETLSKGMVILNKGLVKADGQLDVTGVALKRWGINVKEGIETVKRGNKIIVTNSGHLKDQTKLVQEIADKYSSFATQQERVNFLTEVFGKSGANLVDFFDTLAQEGGIDKVTEKVKKFGLAIDPARYEQFNRNLEELKLIGLGLAVQFTEKIMPVIEGFLDLIANPKSINISKIGEWADNAIGTFLKGLGDSINKWVSGGGPEELTEKVVSWIEDIGDSPTLKSKTLIGAQHLLDAVVKAVKGIGWQDIADAIDEKTAESISDHDWKKSGEAFGKNIVAALTTNIEAPSGGGDSRWLLKLLLPGIDALITFFQTSSTGQAIIDAITGWFDGLEGAITEALIPVANGIKTWFSETGESFSRFGADVVAGFSDGFVAGMNNLETKISEWVRTHIVDPFKAALGISSPSTVFFAIAKDMVLGLILGWASSVSLFIAKLVTLKTDITNKLTDIAKEFYNRAQGWVNQAIQGFQANKGRLLAEIRAIVTSVNAILKKIITSFVLTFSVNAGGLGGASGSSNLGGTTGGGGNPKRKATGGNVSAGQLYRVNEMGRGEYFLPSVNGRIEPQSQQTNAPVRLDEYTIRQIVMGFERSLAKVAG